MYIQSNVIVRILTFSTWCCGSWLCSCFWSCSTSSSSSSSSRNNRRGQTRTGVAAVSIQPTGVELDEAWLIRADVGVDPGLVIGHSGVDSWQIGPSAARTKTNDSRLDPDGALLVHHRTSWVTLRRWRGDVRGCQKILNTFTNNWQIQWSSLPDKSLCLLPEHQHRSCCLWLYRLHWDSHTVCFPELAPPPLEGFQGTAMTLRDQQEERQFTHPSTVHKTYENNHLSATSRLTSLLDCAPASDPAISTVVEHTVTGCQTHRSDVVCELDWWGEFEQSNVVVAGVTVIVWMQNDSGNSSGHFVWVFSLQVLTAERNLPSRRTVTEVKMKENALVLKRTWTKSQTKDLNTIGFILYHVKVTHLKKQWAADITHSLLMREPPQTWLPNPCRLTCQGQLPTGASSPPTILVFRGVMPHTANNSK